MCLEHDTADIPAWLISTPGKVLLVDDSKVHQQLVKAVLDGLGIEVRLADNGFDASLLLGLDHYDLVLTDISMPGLDGNWLLEHIRETRPSIPVIALTGSPQLVTGDFDKVLHKPYPVRDLVRLVVGMLVERRKGKQGT